MDRYKILNNGIVISALIGFSTFFYGLHISNYSKRTDKVDRYYQMEQITNTLDKALKQSYDINFGLDDLKMREALSEAYEISNRQFGQLAKDEEVKKYLSLKTKKDANAKNIMFGGIGLLGLAFIGTVGLSIHNRIRENSTQGTNQIDSKPLNKLLNSLKR